MMAEGGSCDVVCDLCEDEQAVSFCDECQSKVCTFCQALHVRQKQTYAHNLTTIERVKLLLLNVKCSFCDGQAERCCSECNVRLCTKCAMSHHKKCDIPGSPKQASGDHASDGQEITAKYGVSDRTTNFTEDSNEGLPHDNSKILFKDSVPQRSTIIVRELHVQSGVLCDLCEEEIAAWFCEDCQKQMCVFCQQGHMKQKRTKYHKLSAIENTKRPILHTICSSCNQHAEQVCNQCEVPFCTKCSDAHHYLTDTLMPRKEVSNTEPECEDQVSGRHLRPGSLVYKSDTINSTLRSPEIGINQVRFHQVGDQECDGEVSGKVNKSKGRSAEDGAGKCVNYKRGQAFQNIQSFGIAMERKSPPVLSDLCEEASTSICDTYKLKLDTFRHEAHTGRKDRPGKPTVESVLADSVSMVWNAMGNFCEGDMYEVRIENRQTGTWSAKLFETSRGTIEGLQQGTPYVFKVRIVKANGEESKYSENSEKVILKEETKSGEDRPGKPIVESVLADSVNLAWTAVDKVSEGDVYQVRIENTKTGKWELKNFEVNRASIEGLQTGDTYTFKIRLVRANGVQSKYSENSQEVRTTIGTNIKEDRPGKPMVESVFEDSVILVWTAVDNFLGSDVYQVRIENTKTRKWDSKIVSVNRARIDGLQPGEPYVFNVRLIRANRQESNYSENSEEVRTKENTKREEYIPGKPSVTKVYADCVDIIWERVHLDEGDVYQVLIDNTETKEWFYQTFTVNYGTIRDLQPGTSYIFKVRLAKANGDDSKFSEGSEEVTTPKSFASELIKFSVAVNIDRKGPSIYAVPMTERSTARNNSAMTKKFEVGQRARQEIDEKTIILVGATGTGKSTLVDGLTNYILGVRLHDPWRFTVIPEEDRKQSNQASSQTDWISCYSFNPQPGSRLKYRLNVIDTPGFGDTRGLERDQKIVDQIRQLFEAKGKTGIQVLDAVCFLIKAPDSRLTATQTYIFNAIMSLFGQDIEENICTLVTFADGSDPPVLAAVAASGLPFNETFTFNNSALFSDSKLPFTAMFWDMGLESFRKVLKHISGLQRKSIQLTKEVFQERHSLEVTCQYLQTAVNEGLSAVRILKKEIDLFKEYEAEINRNQNFTYYSKEIQQTKVELPVGKHVTNCLTCNRTCHKECVYADDEDKKRCSAMDASGHCKFCPNKCIWSVHKNELYRLEYIEKQVEKTYDDMQKKYKDAKGKTLSLEQLLNRMRKDLQNRIINIVRMVDRMRKCHNRLQEIALRPNPLGMTEHIDLMIQAEKDEAKPGYLDRIEVLRRFRGFAYIDELVNAFMEETLSVQSSLTDVPKERNKGFLRWFLP